jgi:GNAT superfamily N-acetyltransferase
MTDANQHWHIRRARPDEAVILTALQDRSSAHWKYPEGFFDWVPGGTDVTPEYIAQNEVFVLEEGDRLTGFHGLTREDAGLVLDRLFVDLDQIGTGRGKLLWRHAVNVARTMGETSLVIGADPNAASFYAAMGAIRTGEKQTGNRDWVVQMYRYDISPRTINPATVTDARVLHELTQRSVMHWGYEPAFLEWEPESIAVTPEFMQRATTFILREGHDVVGYYALTSEPDGLHLDKLFVEPGWIGTGAGKALWLHAVETARARGERAFRFLADPNAAPFYRAMGAEWIEGIHTDWPDWQLQVFRYTLEPPG